MSGQYDLAGAILFGSRARRNHRPDSDADIAVLLRGPRGRFLDTKLALADIAYDVLLETGAKCDGTAGINSLPENHLDEFTKKFSPC